MERERGRERGGREREESRYIYIIEREQRREGCERERIARGSGIIIKREINKHIKTPVDI